MRRNLIFMLLLISASAFSQPVNETVNFDDPSDQANYFYGTQSLVQVPSNGITGGALMAADSNNWGNDNSRYCTKFGNLPLNTYFVSFKFYYNDSAVSATGFERAASIWLMPATDPNHYLIATVSHSKRIELLTYYTANSTAPMNLVNGHWYELTLQYMISQNDSLNVSAIVADCGTTGTLPPVPVSSLSESLQDTIFSRDAGVEASITGAVRGGGIYIDEFRFNGYKSTDNCLASATENPEGISAAVYAFGEYLKVSGEVTGKGFRILDITGRVIDTGSFRFTENDLDISRLLPGRYFLSINGMKPATFILTE